ncbi:MAG: TIGR01459 family HAD-type hydrolase [Pseudomonadota bacterium]
MSRRIAGLGALIDDVDAVLVDQYGVLHDGQTPFPGARACLETLAARGVPVVAVTNSGKTEEPNRARLARLGFPRALFRGLVSSGAVFRAASVPPGTRVHVVARDGDRSMIEGLDLCEVQPDAAALVLIAGVAPEETRRAAYAQMLAPLAARAVPAICLNPDRTMYTRHGADFGPGVIAEDYAAAGGPVRWIGKPHPEIFEAALGRLPEVPRARVLMVGDSPAHDIAGAAALGLKTLLIEAGVQAGTDGAEPDFRAPSFRW